MEERPFKKLDRAKVIRLNADLVRDLEGGDCHYLSERTKQMALALLEYQTWKTRWYGVVDQDEIDAWVAQAVYEITAEGGDCLSECFDFGPEVDAVAFTPQNPYTDPDFVPTGYAGPPFTVVKPTDVGLIALGLQVGDVITDLTRFPTGSLPTIIPPTGFARFRVTFTGNEIELHLLQIPGGGIVTISYDDDPLTLATLDLSKDVFSLPVETVSVITHQIEFSITGAHHVDVTFVPWVNDAIPFVTYGGGIRSFTVCGSFGGTLMDVRQDPEAPCKLQKTVDGEIWTDFANLRLCPPLLQRDPVTGRLRYSADGTTWFEVADGPWTEPLYPPFSDPPPRAEADEESRRCAAAANAENVIHATFNETSDHLSFTGNTATNVAVGVGAVIAALLFVTAPFWVPLAVVMGAIIAAGVVFNRADYTSEIAEQLRCILYCNSTDSGGVVTFDYDAVRADVQAESGLPWPALDYVLQMITADGLNVAGGTSAITDAECDCPDCLEEWAKEWDFTATSGGWEPASDLVGIVHWVSGQGWTGGNKQQTTVDSVLTITIQVPVGTTITSVHMEGHSGRNIGPLGIGIDPARAVYWTMIVGNYNYTTEGLSWAVEPEEYLSAFNHVPGANYLQTISNIRLTGTGPNPFA